jgi:NAD(P)-dependent dehydrogenase (short-subunit alcohol dehydrogenase family)
MTSSGVVTRDVHLWAGQPDEVAALMSWLSSDEPSTINGAISADGGWSA